MIFRCFGQEEDVVFLETCKQLRKQHHMIIECVPLPKETGDMAPVYFKVGRTVKIPRLTNHNAIWPSTGKLTRVAQVNISVGFAPDWLKDTVMF